MPRGRAVADLPEQVQRLRQSTETWEASLRRQQAWIEPTGQPPYRPYIFMVVSDADFVLQAATTDAPPTLDELGQQLLQTMRRPAANAGPPRRPQQVVLDNAAHVAALAPQLAAIGVGCVYQETLPRLDAIERDLSAHLNGREPIPGLLSMPAVTPALVGHLYALAAAYHEQKPWDWLTDQHPFAIRYPPEAPPRFAVVMGSGGEVFGLAVYDTLTDLQMVYSGLPPEELMRRKSWFALFYEEIVAMSFDDLDALERWNWTRPAREDAYPIFVRTTSTGGAVPPPAADMLWMEGALEAITSYVRRHKRKGRRGTQFADLTLPVSPLAGPAEVRLWLPALRFAR